MIGLQLWTIREECDRDLGDTLARVGAMGYDGVELFQLHGHDPAEVRAMLDGAGLVAAGRHAGLDVLETGLPALAEEVAALGTDRVAVAWIDPAALEQPDQALARVRRVAEAAQEAGLRLGFHNHWSEVVPVAGGRTFLDLLRDLPSDLLWLELDLGWAWHAGADPLAELAASAGRCPLVHVKDYAAREGSDDVPVGTGVVGYDRVASAALGAGAEWLIVEEDEVGPDPFGAIEQSLRNLREMLA